MPIHLTESDISSELDGHRSVLIVPCRFCPAASFAVHADEPYIEFPRRLLRTDSYERFIKRMTVDLRARGVKVGVFKSHLLHQFVLCMWTHRRRQRLVECAREYDAVIVLGCEAAVETIRESLRSTNCHVIAGMDSGGVMSVKPGYRLPCTITLDVESISPVGGPRQPSPVGDETLASST